jgi:hypothetical protein
VSEPINCECNLLTFKALAEKVQRGEGTNPEKGGMPFRAEEKTRRSATCVPLKPNTVKNFYFFIV